MLWLLACAAPDVRPEAAPRPMPAPALVGATPYRLEVAIRPDPAAGVLHVRETFHGLQATAPFLVRLSEEVVIENVAAAGVTLVPEPGRWRVEGPLPDPLVVSHTARPGALGRHGHQGFVGKDFATFDGRALLHVRAESPLAEARFRFELPDGWAVASALRADGDDWLLEPPLRSLLEDACLAVGPFRRDDHTAGATMIRTFVHDAVPTELRERIVHETHAFADAFRTAGFDPGGTLAFVRYPAVDGSPLFGGSSALGACFEDVKPGEPEMDTRLLGHRFAHPMNRYAPSGWMFRDDRDAWFEEGHAGWAEVELGVAAGVYGTDDPTFWWDRAYQGFLTAWREHPERQIPIARDARALDADHTEYLHYELAPLVVRLLDHLLQERGSTDLVAVSRALAAERSGHRGAIPLREAIDRLGHASYADFWEAAVDSPPHLAPVWPGWVTDTMRANHAADPTDTARTAWLADRAERFHDVLDDLVDEQIRRRELADLGITLAHADVLANVRGMPPEARQQLFLAEQAWPRHGARVARDGVELALDPVFVELLAAEDRYDAARGEPTSVRAIDLEDRDKGEKGRPTLVVPIGERIEVRVRYLRTPAVARIELVQGDRVETRDLVTTPGKDEAKFAFHSKDRPDRPGVLTVRVLTDGGVVERAFWVR